MKPNPKCLLEITHSARGLTTIEKSWAAVGWEWFGPHNPELKRMFEELAAKGVTTYTDAQGTLTIRIKDGYLITLD